MQLLKKMQAYGHEEVTFWFDKESGLKAIIAIHDTTLGPALGGTRMWPYGSEAAALRDVLRLSAGMTYKAAVAGLDLGGGKAVIIGDPARDKSEALFRSFGRFVNSLNGRYITAEDVGTNVEDMVQVRQETCFVTGLPSSKGGSGDPSSVTAFGVYQGMKACCRTVFGSDLLAGRSVAIQGVGKVGTALAKHLYQAGARLLVADVNPRAVEKMCHRFDVEPVAAERIYEVECDIFAPCALGAIINDETIPKLRCAIVAGSANNQLAEARHGDELKRRGILYAPDYVINAGGLINVASELGAYDAPEAWSRAAAIYHTLQRVIELAKAEGIATHLAAQRLAMERITQGKQRQVKPQPTDPWQSLEWKPLRLTA